MDTSPEFHLFIIWNTGLHKAAEIIGEMQSSFVVQRVYAVRWTEERFSENLSRFYGNQVPRDSCKEAHCGRGPFLAVVLMDENPRYEFRQTCRGRQFVNVNCFVAKERYRELAGGGHRIHGTYTPSEAERDLTLLLHSNPAEYLLANPARWNGEIQELDNDLLGANGWKDTAELFRVLNSSTNYAVIRNFELLSPDHPADHLDIDLLCTSISELAALANATRCCPEPYRALYRVNIAGSDLPLHLRSVESNYFDPGWARDMLERRVLSHSGFYHLSSEDHFYCLLYHAIVHRPAAASNYRKQLLNLPFKPPELTDESSFEYGPGREVLNRFLSSRGYRVVEPNDLSVDFDSDFANIRKRSVLRIAMDSESLARSLEQLFEQTEDCSIESRDFQKPEFRSDQAIRYFSANRALFLDGLQLPATSSILEFGAESGVLTRWLGERFETVAALDSDIEFCRAVKKRCKDLDSVRVFNSDDSTFKPARSFDVAVAIMDEKSKKAIPVLSVLKRAKQALKKTGLLVLGLDVTPNVPSMRDVLVQQLKSYGFTGIRFFYAFPNVIFPRAIFSDDAVRASQKSYGYWAASVVNDASVGRINELQAAGLSARGKLDEIASACYIVATRDASALPSIPWQVIGASSEFRPACFRTSIQVTADGSALTVRKRATAHASGVFQFCPAEELPLFDGHGVKAALTYAVQNGDLGSFLSIYKTYAGHLIREFEFFGGDAYPALLADNDILLRGEALDAIPQNGVIQDDSYALFDLEWRLSIPLPLSYVLYRGLSAFFLNVPPETVWKAFRLADYGMPTIPSVPDLCAFIINSLSVVGRLKGQAPQLLDAFDSRVDDFIRNGEVASGAAPLLERYYLAIALHAQQDFEAFDGVIAEMRTIYPDVPALPEFVGESIT